MEMDAFSETWGMYQGTQCTSLKAILMANSTTQLNHRGLSFEHIMCHENIRSFCKVEPDDDDYDDA